MQQTLLDPLQAEHYVSFFSGGPPALVVLLMPTLLGQGPGLRVHLTHHLPSFHSLPSPPCAAGFWYDTTLPAASLDPVNFMHIIPSWVNSTRPQFFVSYREPKMGDMRLETAWQNKVMVYAWNGTQYRNTGDKTFMFANLSIGASYRNENNRFVVR